MICSVYYICQYTCSIIFIFLLNFFGIVLEKFGLLVDGWCTLWWIVFIRNS